MSYFERYKHYKEKCSRMTKKMKEMDEELQEMKGNIESCWKLLGTSINKPSLPSPVLVSTPKSGGSVPKQICFTVDSESDDNDENLLLQCEPGGNKWECYSEEQQRLLSSAGMLNHSQLNPNDPEETNYEPLENSSAERKAAGDGNSDSESEKSTPKRRHNDKTKVLNELPAELLSAETPKATHQKKRGKRTPDNDMPTKILNELPAQQLSAETPKATRQKKRVKGTPEHVCVWPCYQHQKFYVSSKRAMAKLSPRSRQMATTVRQKSPKGYWNLDMPSTQEIRSRNQDIN